MKAMSKKEQSKVWFITGLSRGFGRELASAALEQGDVVIGTSRNGKSDIGAVPDRFHVFALEVTNRQDVVSVVTQAWQIGGRIDVVVNNAGFGVLGAVEEVEEKQARDVFETNFFGLLSVTQAALPHLRTQRMFEKSWQIKTHGTLTRVRPSCLEAGMGKHSRRNMTESGLFKHPLKAVELVLWPFLGEEVLTQYHHSVISNGKRIGDLSQQTLPHDDRELVVPDFEFLV
jgi:NAD(P)-dependent dehydrogenase (short-subunit alcohol dehydrogenase family)